MRTDYKNAERRYDELGELRLMARAEGYVMVRRRGAIPRVMTELEWAAMAAEPIASAEWANQRRSV